MSDDDTRTRVDERRRILAELDLERNQLIRNIETCRIRDIERAFVGNWSLRDIVGHIATWEGEVLAALRELRAGRRPALLDFDPAKLHEFNEDHVERKRDINFWALYEQLKGTRARLLDELDEVDDETLTGEGSVHARFILWLADHDRQHWHDIAAKLAGMPGARHDAMAESLPGTFVPNAVEPARV